MTTAARWEGLDQDAIEAWGRRIGAEAAAPLTIALEGPLGAGKSVLARAIARGAGVSGEVPSPTYTLLNRYRPAADREIVHIDLYRIRDPDELVELGWDELGADSEIVLVEWPDRAGDRMPSDRWVVGLDPEPDAAALRTVRLSRVGCPSELPVPREAG